MTTKIKKDKNGRKKPILTYRIINTIQENLAWSRGYREGTNLEAMRNAKNLGDKILPLEKFTTYLQTIYIYKMNRGHLCRMEVRWEERKRQRKDNQ